MNLKSTKSIFKITAIILVIIVISCSYVYKDNIIELYYQLKGTARYDITIYNPNPKVLENIKIFTDDENEVIIPSIGSSIANSFPQTHIEQTTKEITISTSILGTNSIKLSYYDNEGNIQYYNIHENAWPGIHKIKIDIVSIDSSGKLEFNIYY